MQILRSIANANSIETFLAPLELKTAKNENDSIKIEHKAQVLLYLLLMNDHYNVGVEYGLVYYLGNCKLIGLMSNSDEIRGLIIRRNEIAKQLQIEQLPSVLEQTNFTKSPCADCGQLECCSLYYKISQLNEQNKSLAESF